MGARQVDRIERGIESANMQLSVLNDSPKLCANFESQNSFGEYVWVQVFAGSVNTMYPFGDEPLQRLQFIGLRTPAGAALDEWEPHTFATFGLDGVSRRDQAEFVDQLFVRLLGCDDSDYEILSTIEDLE